MNIYAISDLHLGPGQGKGHFSSKWVDHQPQLRENWDELIEEDSIVLMPGDFSWNSNPKDLHYDYTWIDDRPGTVKIMTAGNHDYGIWSEEASAKAFVEDFESLHALLGSAMRIENPGGDHLPGLVIAATTGSNTPADRYFGSKSGFSAQFRDDDDKLFVAELKQLHRALQRAKQLQRAGDALIVMLHYPPFANCYQATLYSRLIEAVGVDLCVYGHLHHARQWPTIFQGNHNGTEYRFASADFLNWEVSTIGQFDQQGLHIAPPERMAITSWGWDNAEDKWVSYIWTAFTNQELDSVEVEGDARAHDPPPCSEDWDPNSLAYNHYLDFDPAFVPAGYPERIRDDGSIRKKEQSRSGGPFGEMAWSTDTGSSRTTRPHRSRRDERSEAIRDMLREERARSSTPNREDPTSPQSASSPEHGYIERAPKQCDDTQCSSGQMEGGLAPVTDPPAMRPPDCASRANRAELGCLPGSATQFNLTSFATSSMDAGQVDLIMQAALQSDVWMGEA